MKTYLLLNDFRIYEKIQIFFLNIDLITYMILFDKMIKYFRYYIICILLLR